MEKIALFCKTFDRDFERFKVLYESYLKYNTDNLKLIVSVPIKDIELFKTILNNDAILMSDDDIYKSDNLLPGWMQQQTIKLNIHRTNIAENYFMLDSDEYFIKPCYIYDFIFNDYPYFVCHEQKELFQLSELVKYSLPYGDPKVMFENDKTNVMNVFGRTGKKYDFGPAPMIWNSEVLKSFENEFVKGDYSRVLGICPSEITWYGEWFLNTRPFDLMPSESYFKVYHYEFQYNLDKQLGITESHLQRNFMGVCMQSNWNSPLKY